MELSDHRQLISFLKKHHLYAKKRLGQNFLVDESILQKIVTAADLKKSDLVVEVGAGLGVLTQKLSKQAKKVVALEIDEKLAFVLRETTADCKNLEIKNLDVLKYQPPQEKFKVVANIPYYITSPILRHFLQREMRPEIIILLIQKEVAEKICSNEESVLSLGVKVFGRPEVVAPVPKKSFFPAPKVDSAILKITAYPEIAVKCPLPDFFRLIKIGFSQPRKKLINNLAAGLHLPKEELISKLEKLSIDPSLRPQKLRIEQWEQLVNGL
ncbi:MAG TPA: ribosomal RNA small subunit methyltransferase A [Candidatus Peregrinibacteria bacterium]|nr:ribosomal RNA small subunit methyltransferase A [Candidatus Peregrinibacteria bacterium]